MSKSAIAPLLFLLAVSSVCGGAETPPSVLNPRQPPLAVLRLPRPESAEAVCASGPLRLFGLAERDWDPRLPGLSRVAGIRAFFARLGDAGGEDFWFCLAELSRSALGWRWRPPAGDPDTARAAAEALLLDSGFDLSRGVVASEPLGDGSYQVAFAPNGKLLSSLRGDGEMRESGWRDSLAAFMARSEDGIGLWLDPRPLSGFAAMTMGFDLRSRCADIGVDLPDAVVAWIVPHGDVPGFHFRADGFVPPGLTAASPVISSAGEKTATFPAPPLFRLDFRLSGLRDSAARGFPPVPPGVDWQKLFPDAASFGVWRGDYGGMEWAFVGDLADGDGAFRAFRRLADWLLVFLPGQGGGDAAKPLADSETTCALFLGTDPAALVAGVKRDGAARALVFLANIDPARLSGFSEVSPRPAVFAGSLEVKWNSRLDSAALETLAGELRLPAFVARRLGPEAWRSIIGAGETGRLALEDGGLSVDSPRGALIWMLPAAGFYAERIWKSIQPDPPVLAVARLRFLLHAAGLSRFRAAGPGELTPTALPAALQSLAFADPDGLAWLDNALPGFPGLGGPNGRVLSLLAGGTPIDGYGYAIDTLAGWHIVAKPTTADWPVLRIDADGSVTENQKTGEWLPYRETLSDWVAGINAF